MDTELASDSVEDTTAETGRECAEGASRTSHASVDAAGLGAIEHAPPLSLPRSWGPEPTILTETALSSL